jgi:UDP-N-acetylmuramoyl-tripeptide--D-alanyl-D-alanine ligase
MSSFIEFLYSRFLLSDGVSIDTRSLKEGNLFFALKGPNFDGNQFARQAVEQGASYAVVSDSSLADGETFIHAEDTEAALQQLAVFHRDRFKRPVIGITGSNGKTTTKELINGVLSEKYVTYATVGNYNNHLGVPLSILHIHPQVEIAIIEMGANRVGEIAFLSAIAKPTHGLITNIGRAHTETFGGIEGIIRGKSELFDYLIKNQGQVFVNDADVVLSAMKKRFDAPMLFPSDDLKLKAITPFLILELGDEKVETQLTGKYNFGNIAAAVALGRHFEVPDHLILKAIGEYRPSNARSEVIQKGDLTIFLDAYNANPDSMKAAIENLSNYDGKKLAILGDMDELEDPDASHKEVIEFAIEKKVPVLTVGKRFGLVSHQDHFQTKADLIEYLEKKSFSGYHVLLKASRSVKLETIEKNINAWT